MDGLFIYLAFLVFLIMASAFFSGSEAALFSLSSTDIKRLEAQSPAGRRIGGLLSSPRDILITILIGNLIVNVVSTSAATSVAVSLLGDKGVGVAFVFMSVLILIAGEITPKALAINRPRRASVLIVYPLLFFHALFLVIRIPIARLTESVLESLQKRLGKARRSFSTDELITAFDIGHADGHIGVFEYELLSNIVEFRDTVVKEIMTPSINVFSLPVTMGREDMLEAIVNSEYSRVPVYDDTADDILGVVHIKELATVAGAGSEFDVKAVLQVPHYVPESTRIAELFKQLAAQRQHFAIVIDEYGSYVGIATMEDILEELVGEIRDANEPRREEYTVMDDKRIIVLGTMPIDEFNEVFDTNIVDEDNETMAGYVTGEVGFIPHEGRTIDIGDLRFHIVSAQPNRIRKMRVEKR